MAQAQTVEIPKRFPLVITPENRNDSAAKDAKLVNCYLEQAGDGEYWIFKRSGLLYSSQPPGGAANGYGMFNWLGNIYSIFGNKLYKDGVAIAGTVDTTNGVYRFDSCLGATPKMVFGNGVKAYTYDDGSGLVQITDVDFPAAFVKGWAYLDGTTYVGKSNANIQGSGINNPQSWAADNTIVAQIEPDQGVALAKQLIYVIMLKQWGTEVFYDAGNATGSPLASVPGAKVNYGCVTSDSVQSIDGILIWVCTNQSSSTQVMKMEGLKPQIISTDPVERLLDDVDFTVTYSMQFKNQGHRFYILTVKNSNLTLVYDLDENTWHQWTDKNGNYFPYVSTTYDSAALKHRFQHESNGKIYLAEETYYTDDGDPIVIDIVTPNFDGEIDRRKQMNRLTFLADQVAGSTLQVRFNDQDYDPTKWTNFRQVDLSKRLPTLMNCGTFIRRAMNLRHKSATAFRMKAVNMQLDIGTL